MLTKNAQIFKSYFAAKGIDLEFSEEEGHSIVDIGQMTDSGIKIRFTIVFNKKNSLVAISGTDFIKGLNQAKNNQILEAINNLNNQYSFLKFVVANDSISIQGHSILEGNFSSEVIMRILLSIIDAVEAEYPKLKKINR